MKYIVQINDKQYEVEVERGRAALLNTTVVESAPPAAFAPVPPASAAPASAAPAVSAAGNGTAVTAPMPGVILGISVKEGQAVKKGDLLVTMEAMKMENEIMAPRDGVIAQILTTRGASVTTGAPLLTLR